MSDYIEVDGLRVGPCMWRSKVEEVEQLRAANRDLQVWFDDARATAEQLQARVAELESFINQAPVETGVCMCGEEMYRHGSQPNHTPMDSWDYERDLILRDEAEKAGGES